MRNDIENTPYLMFGKSKGYEELFNVKIVGPQAFYLEGNSLIKEVADEQIYWLPTTLSSKWLIDRKFDAKIVNERAKFLEYQARESHRLLTKHKAITVLDENNIYVDLTHPFGWYAFGHLHDSLQRVFNVKDFVLDNKNKVKFLVSRHDRVNDFFEHLSVFAGYKVTKDDVVLIEDGVYAVGHVVKPNSPSVYTNFREDVYEWMILRYKNYFETGSINLQRKKLYLTRNHVKPGSRGVSNEDDFIHLLENSGFTIVRGNESLELMYHLFSSAERIIGPHGSLFANSIFAPKDCSILEFCPDNRVDTSFLRKEKVAVDYQQILLQGDELFNVNISSEYISQAID